MKRSRMIAEIAEVVHDMYLLNDTEIARAILARIEELGMKPPVEDVCPVLFQTKHVWEEEDDRP